MAERDPLYTVELVRALEEATSMLRHDVRNRLGSIRNMAYFVAKRVNGSELVKGEPRIAEFLSRIESEVQLADEIMEVWFAALRRVYPDRVETLQARAAMTLAVAALRSESDVNVEIECEDAELEVDGTELALGLRCLLENAAEAASDGQVRIKGTVERASYRFLVENRGAPLPETARRFQRLDSDKSGHLGIGLCLARRVAQRYAGKLVFADTPSGVEVSLDLPLAGKTPRAHEGTP
jgi:signal transduction histidine kinase